MTLQAIVTSGVIALSLLSSAQAQEPQETATTHDPEVDALREKFEKFYGGLEAITIKTQTTIKAVTANAPPALKQASTIQIMRPNFFLTKCENTSIPGFDACSDGKTMIIGMPMIRRYQQTAAPKDFAALFPSSESDTEHKTAELFAPDPALFFSLALFGDTHSSSEEKDTMSIVGHELFEGQSATKLRRVGSNGDSIYMWIADGDEPWLLGLKASMKTPDSFGLEFNVRFDSRKNDELTAKSFNLVPPANWMRVDNIRDAAQAPARPAPRAPAPPPEKAEEHATLGTKAPDFSLPTLRNGEKVSLESLKGKVVVLDFWATWCGPCVAGLPTVDKVTTAFKDRGVAFYAIDLRESASKVQSFVDKKKWAFPVLMDTKGEVAKAYGVRGIPHSVVIGKDGRIRNVHVGFSGAAALEKQLTEELEAALEESSSAQKQALAH